MKEKDILCDSGSLITLTSACMDRTLYFLHEKFGVRFIIPPSVEYETISRPLYGGLNHFAFSAIRIKEALNDNILTKIEGNVRSEAKRILDLANNVFYVKGNQLNLIQIGEAEMLALASSIDVNNILLDERTTRMLIEAPFKLKEHLETEFSATIMVDSDRMHKFSDAFKSMNVIRSSEIVIIAYENGFLDHFNSLKKEALEAVLYKVKYAGCSIRFDEIRQYIKTVK